MESGQTAVYDIAMRISWVIKKNCAPRTHTHRGQREKTKTHGNTHTLSPHAFFLKKKPVLVFYWGYVGLRVRSIVQFSAQNDYDAQEGFFFINIYTNVM